MQKQLSERLDAAEMIFQLRQVAVSRFMHCSRNPQTSFFNKTFIKNESHYIIHISVISDIQTYHKYFFFFFSHCGILDVSVQTNKKYVKYFKKFPHA